MKKIIYILFLLTLLVHSVSAQRQVEELNRGLIAIYKGGSTVYLSWRLLAKDDWTIGFNVYRSTNGAAAVKLNAAPVTNSTNYSDASADITKSNVYYVKTVVDGVELETSESFTLAANTPNRQFFLVNLQSTPITYDVLHVYAGDVDGDGDFDYIVKRMPSDAKYNYIFLECYLNDGTFKWRINLGPNVETYISTMTSPVLVADFNGDGKAEIIAKTGEATTFGNGYTIPDTNGDGKTDYNTHAGSGTQANIFEGPEFISLINGETGAEINRNNFIARGKTSDWGDSYGARVNFIMSSVCSFDGVKPGVIFSRGEGSRMVVEAWDVTNNTLSKKWNWTAVGKTFNPGGWVDFHQIQCIDVNADGKDEISWGACMMNPNGTIRYTTGLVHGDRFQITDINPNRPGLEVFAIQQNNPSLLGSAIYDASNGSIIKGWYSSALQDVGRGDVADIDPNFPGMEMFDLVANDVHASNGTTAITGARPYPDVSIWWDADLQREFFRGIGGSGFNPAIEKWDYVNKSQYRLFTMYSDWGSYSIISPYAGRAPFIGDIMGDWREEIILETSDHTGIRIYTSKDETTYRIYTLMQNPAYRNSTTSKGYLCTKYTDYFLGAGMATPPKPNIVVIGTGNNAPNVTLSSPKDATSFTGPTTITLSAVASDRDGTISKIEFYQGTTLIGTVTSAPYTFSWTNVPGGTYIITAKATDNNGASTASQAVTITVSGFDCAGVQNGTAYLDHCQVCVGGTTDLDACTSDKIQAEDVCSFDGTVDNNNPGFEGVGFVNSPNAIGAKISFYINASTATSIMLDVIYANGGTTDRGARVLINDVETVANFSLPPTGAWTTYSPAETSIALSTGINKIELIALTDGGLPNLDFFELWGDAKFSACPVTQTITLAQGWNLMSINIIPDDNSIATLFGGLDVQAIKTMDSFWFKDQPVFLNALQTIEPGEGYLVKMNATGILSIEGVTLSHSLNVVQKNGWQMIGCPYQTVIPFSTDFNSTNCQIIKNFDGFWIPDGTMNSIQNMEPGKGYFFKK